jgi:hypothetical protein
LEKVLFREYCALDGHGHSSAKRNSPANIMSRITMWGLLKGGNYANDFTTGEKSSTIKAPVDPGGRKEYGL